MSLFEDLDKTTEKTIWNLMLAVLIIVLIMLPTFCFRVSKSEREYLQRETYQSVPTRPKHE